jgi:hypothetical protein
MAGRSKKHVAAVGSASRGASAKVAAATASACGTSASRVDTRSVWGTDLSGRSPCPPSVGSGCMTTLDGFASFSGPGPRSTQPPGSSGSLQEPGFSSPHRSARYPLVCQSQRPCPRRSSWARPPAVSRTGGGRLCRSRRRPCRVRGCGKIGRNRGRALAGQPSLVLPASPTAAQFPLLVASETRLPEPRKNRQAAST